MAAGDNTNQRINVATKMIAAATAVVDNLKLLNAYAEQRGKFTSPWQDTDFANTNSQVTAAMIGVLCDFVVPSLQANYLDVANGGRNEQILLQVRAG